VYNPHGMQCDRGDSFGPMIAFIAVVAFAPAVAVIWAQSGVPAAPTQVAATVIGNSVTLTWVTPIGSPPITGYIIEATLTPGGAVVARLPIAVANSFSVIAPPGVYYVRVRAANGSVEGTPSNEVLVAVGQSQTCSEGPTPPRTLVAAVTGNAVNFAWQPPTSGVVDRYELRAGTQPGARTTAIVNAGSATTFSALAPQGTYYVAAVAINSCGISAESNEATITIGTSSPLPAPSPQCPRVNACIVEGALVMSYASYAQVFPNALPTAPGNWAWEQILNDVDEVIDVGGYDFVLLFTKSLLPGTGSRVNSGAQLRGQNARNNGLDRRFVNRRYSVRDFGPRLKAMPFLDTIGRPPPSATIFHEVGHFWPVAPAYRVIDRTTWNPATDSVAWLATSCDPQGHWCGPWYGGQTGPALANVPGLMAVNGNGSRFNPFDLHVIGLMGYAEVSAFTFYVEAPTGPLRPTPLRYPITQDLIVASRRLRPDASEYVEGDGRRVPDVDPAMTDVRMLVLVIKQDNEVLTDGERAVMGSLVQGLPADWDFATYSRSRVSLPFLLR
jgi:fibronectin type III domain protein